MALAQIEGQVAPVLHVRHGCNFFPGLPGFPTGRPDSFQQQRKFLETGFAVHLPQDAGVRCPRDAIG
jgi:hypothetical protein